MDDLLTRYNKLLRQYEVLHKENEVLISLLKIHGIEYETRMKEDMNKPIYILWFQFQLLLFRLMSA